MYTDPWPFGLKKHLEFIVDPETLYSCPHGVVRLFPELATRLSRRGPGTWDKWESSTSRPRTLGRRAWQGQGQGFLHDTSAVTWLLLNFTLVLWSFGVLVGVALISISPNYTSPHAEWGRGGGGGRGLLILKQRQLKHQKIKSLKISSRAAKARPATR